jgi:hypothetical protein
MNALAGLLRAARDILARVFRRGATAAQDQKARRQRTDQRLRNEAHLRGDAGERT